DVLGAAGEAAAGRERAGSRGGAVDPGGIEREHRHADDAVVDLGAVRGGLTPGVCRVVGGAVAVVVAAVAALGAAGPARAIVGLVVVGVTGAAGLGGEIDRAVTVVVQTVRAARLLAGLGGGGRGGQLADEPGRAGVDVGHAGVALGDVGGDGELVVARRA